MKHASNQWLWLLVLAAWVGGAGPVRADAVDDALSQIEEGELDAALRSLENAAPTTRAQYLRMLEARARIAFARDEESTLASALRALDALEPEYRFGRSVPPDLGERLQAMNTPPLSLRVEVSDVGSGSSLRVRLDDAAGLVESTQLHVRTGDEQLDTGESTLAVPVQPGGRIAIWAEALGPSGVLLATHGTESAPHEHIRPGTPAEVAELTQSDPGPAPTVADEGPRRRRIIIGVVVAVVVALIGVAISSVFYQRKNRDTQLGDPVLD